MTDKLPGQMSPLVAVAPSLRTAAGSAAVVTVSITNRSTQPQHFEVLVGGVDPSWLPHRGADDPGESLAAGVRVPERTALLSPGETAEVALTVAPPAGTMPARYPLVVTVRPLAQVGVGLRPAGAVVVAESTLIVNPRAHLTLEMEPSRTTMVRSRKLVVTVGNTGTEPATVTLSDPPSPGLDVRLSRRSIEVPPGGSVKVKGRLVVRRPRRLGSVADHSWAITAATSEVVRQARGVARQRPLFGGSLVRALVLVLVVAVWVAGAYKGVPKLVETLQKDKSDTAETAGAGANDDATGGDDPAGEGDPEGDPGSGGGAGARAAAARLLLSGTIMADDPSGFSVDVRRTNLYGADASNAEKTDAVQLSNAAYGLIPGSYVATTAVADARRRVDYGRVTSTKDGAWAVERIPVTGFYVIEISKAGYQTRKIFVDPNDAKAGDPREIAMVPATGSLTGQINGIGATGRAAAPVGAATVTVSDGTNVLSTKTNAIGAGKGSWKITGLDAPGTYVVTASAPGFGTQARVVSLGPDGTEQVGLTLTQGRFAFTGMVSGPAITGGEATVGIPGATVTVDDGQGNLRSATTISAQDADRNPGPLGAAGAFVVQDIVVPGTYTVTISAPGFQTARQQLELPGKGGRFTFNGEVVPAAGARVTLTRATGMVTGSVRMTPAAARATNGADVRGTGLLLSNDTDTYKIQVAGSGGGFAFFGVNPGIYQLVGNLYDLHVGVQTIEVLPGAPDDPVKLKLDVDGTGVGGATSQAHVTFQVVEANTGDPIVCPDATPGCITATLSHDDDIDGTVTIEPDGVVTVPRAGGVEPGLYTIRVAAPGYEDYVNAQLQIGLAAKDLGTLELFPRPIITGRVSAASGTTTEPTCVWAIAVTDANAATPPDAPVDCVDTDTTSCPDSAGGVTTTGTGPVCARLADGTGDYSLTVPRRGVYWVFADPVSPDGVAEFRAPPAARVSAPIGGTASFNIVLNRLARATFRVLQAGGAGGLSPSAGATVTLTRTDVPTPVAVDDTSGADGIIEFGGLEPGTYSVSAVKTVVGGDDPGTYSGSIATLNLALDQNPTRVLALTNPVSGFLGQVTSNVSGVPVTVSGATVRVTGTTDYADTTPITSTVQSSTNNDGCFQIGVAAVIAPCAESLTDSDPATVTFATPTVTEVSVVAPHYDPFLVNNRRLARDGVNAFSLEPSPRGFTVTPRVTTNPTTPTTSGFSLGQVNIAVTSSVSATSTIAVQVAANGDLEWHDSRYPVGQVKPGTYRVTASYPGFVPATTTIVCDVEPGTCQANGALLLEEYGTLTVSTSGTLGLPPSINATVSLYQGDQLVNTNRAAAGGNVVTFNGLAPASNYNLRVHETGFAYVDGPDDPDAATNLSCDLAASDGGRITVDPGTQQVCVLKLIRLPSITGTVTGVQGTQADDPTIQLAGVTVTATRCVSGQCTSRVTSTDAEGKYSLSSTDSFEGFRAGQSWQVTAALSGWNNPDPAAVPPLTIVENGSDQIQDLTLQVTPVTFSVDVKDGLGTPVTGATVKLLPGTATATSPVDGRYTFTNVVPGYYAVSITADGIIQTTFQVEVRAITSAQIFPAFVSRGQNEVSGTVTSDGAAVAGVEVAMLSCASTPCETTPAKGTDNELLKITTGADGAFKFTTAPDGRYAFTATLAGYTQTSPGTTYVFAHNTPSSPVALTLTAATSAVTVSAANAEAGSGDPLSGTTFSIAPVPWSTYSTPTTTLSGASTYTVRFGCWEVTATLPPGHFGSYQVTQNRMTEADEQTAECGGDHQFLVSPNSTPATTAVTVKVAEVPLKVAVTTKAQPKHLAPADAALRINGPQVPANYTPTTGSVTTVPATVPPGSPVGATVIWVPKPSGSSSATYTVRATPASTVLAAFWSPVDVTATVSASTTAATGATAVAALVEATASQQLQIENETGADYPTTITVVPSDSTKNDPIIVPNVLNDATITLQLPSGTWTITATPATGGAVSAPVTISGTSPTAITLRPTAPPPDGGGDPGGGDPPP